jgi:hypothetical protein
MLYIKAQSMTKTRLKSITDLISLLDIKYFLPVNDNASVFVYIFILFKYFIYIYSWQKRH